MFTEDREKRLRGVIENLRNQLKRIGDENRELSGKVGQLERENSALMEKLSIYEGSKDVTEVVEKLKSEILEKEKEIEKLSKELKEVSQKLKDKEDSNAKIANLCNILLRDKTSLMDANRKLYATIEDMRTTIEKLEATNTELQERINQTVRLLQPG